ncbi:MAG: hypothetical protein OXU39_00250 [Gemmatimonadota bacterium]|nr:hypothetical protein [Gemmatimonadota bacterium]MDE3004514.1 hypothetical protein [Gemmatimonadota bacterium]
MNMRRFAKSGALLTLLAAVACDDSADLVDFDNLTPAEQIELSVLEDQGAWEVTVEVARGAITPIMPTGDQALTDRRLRLRLDRWRRSGD